MTSKRNWLYPALALAGGFLGGMVATQLAPGVAIAARHVRSVSAEQFVLVNEKGAQRGVMQVTKRGAADLQLMDANGRDRAEFRVTADGAAGVNFYDQNGARRVVVGGASPGPSGIAVYGSDGRRQVATLAVSANDEARLTLYDPTSGRARAGLGVTADGQPALVMFDQNGKDRVEIHVGPKGHPGIALADENGKSIAGLPEQAAPAQAQ
jgi:hypothetical protein